MFLYLTLARALKGIRFCVHSMSERLHHLQGLTSRPCAFSPKIAHRKAAVVICAPDTTSLPRE